MPELLVDYITSLDGYGAAEGWPGWWGLEGPEYLAWLEDEPEADYTVLIGANTYRLMSGLADEGEPGTEGLAGLSKVVFSSSLSEPQEARIKAALAELPPGSRALVAGFLFEMIDPPEREKAALLSRKGADR